MGADLDMQANPCIAAAGTIRVTTMTAAPDDQTAPYISLMRRSIRE
jgi:hypothetical protein